MRERVVLYGLGNEFRKNIAFLSEKYEIVACTDSSGECQYTEWKKLYINVKDIDKMLYDKIIICSTLFHDTIRYILENVLHIAHNKICSIEGEAWENFHSEKDYCRALSTMEEYVKKNNRKEFEVDDRSLYLISNEYYKEAADPLVHYFAQDIWGARKIMGNNPKVHYDVGSRLDGFISHLLVFLGSVNYIDIRPLSYEIKGLNFCKGDATELSQFEDESIESLSSFHAIEHFGLGRYGDPIDPEACFKALHSFQRVLKKGGYLYLGVPVEPKDRLVFNAHRIFSPMTIIQEVPQMELEEFAVVKGNNMIAEEITIDKIKGELENIPNYSCGLFVFKKS